MIQNINSHPVRVTENVMKKKGTSRFGLGGCLGGQLSKGCRERKSAKQFVSFASRSPDVGMACQLLATLISGFTFLSPGMFCGRKAKRKMFVGPEMLREENSDYHQVVGNGASCQICGRGCQVRQVESQVRVIKSA